MAINYEEILDIRLNDRDWGIHATIRHYLHELLLTLWQEQERFSGKSPFGNSGWHQPLYKALVLAGVVEGRVDEEGCLDWLEEERAYDMIESAITYMCGKR